MAISRRQFIKTGIFGGIALGTVGYVGTGTFWGSDTRLAKHGDYQCRFLSEADYRAMYAIVPSILAGALPQDSPELIHGVVRDFDKGASGLKPAAQKELRELFTLLTLPPTRFLAAGVRNSWEKAKRSQIDAFLLNWRSSRFMLLRSAYDALQQLTVAGWYGNPVSWQSIGYEGPPRFS